MAFLQTEVLMKHPFFLVNTLVALTTCCFANQAEYKNNSSYDFVFIDEAESDDLFDDSPIADMNESEMNSSSQGYASPDNTKSNTTSSITDMKQMQGEPLGSTGFSAGYNAPAVIAANHKDMALSSDSVCMFVDSAFTYWYAGEDGLDLATSGALTSQTLYYEQNAKTLTQTSSYKPGFKVALGIVADQEWSAKAEYTWYRGTNETNSTITGTALTAGVSTATASSGTSVWAIDDWFLQGTPSGQALSGSTVSSSWHLAMDIGDAVFSRPFYTGRSVTVSPFAGLRTAWIRQTMTVNLTEDPSLFSGAISAQPIQSRNSSNSWSVGAIMGCESNWLLPMGVRFEGNASASLLYTQYTSIKHSEDVASTTFNQIPYNISMTNYNTVRPMAQLGLGMGWGKYLGDGNYHLDFSADYSFMMFWSQNMFRKLIDHNLSGTGSTPGDLYLHGLTVTARFDF
jgi:hypothetical protein